jgi:adenylate cyclase
MKPESSPELPTGTVTFLFTDLQDSTRLWEKYPAVMGQALQRHDEIIETIAQQHNGFIVRPRGEGDSRFAVFVRAIDTLTAAAAIQRTLHAESWPEQLSLKVRMGVHTGEGEFRDGDYYGTAVNRCARLRGIASGGQTLLSHATYELVQDNLPEGIELLDLGEYPLKGLLRPEHIYQLMAPGLPSDFPPLATEYHLSGGVPNLPAFLELEAEMERNVAEKPVFVARERELERFSVFLDKTKQGNGQIVFITGGAGRGKTALIDEFCWRLMGGLPEIIIAKGHCDAHTGVGDAYLPFRDVAAMLTGDLEASLTAGAITPDYARHLWNIIPRTVDAIIQRGSSLIDVFVHGESLLARTEIADPDDINRLRRLKGLVERKKSATVDLEQNLLFEQFTNILLLLAEISPLLLVLDDFQWADNASLDLLFHLGKRIKNHRILVLVAYRLEEVALGRDGKRHPLDTIVNELKRIYGEIGIDLSDEGGDDAGEFVDLFINTEPNNLSDEFRQTLKNHTGGHPLFTIELLRTMQESGDLVQNSQGIWVEGEHLDWDKLPPRVEAVVEERIGRLEDHLRELLSVASVEGEDFTAQVVARVQEIKERQLLRELSQELEKRHRLIRERSELNIDGHMLSRYRFAHQLYQRYLYNDLSAGERRLLHREIGEVLEDLFEDTTEQHAVQLAMHYSQAGVKDKALHYLTLAGKQAQAKYANQEAIHYFTRALDLLPEDHPERFELLKARAKAFELAGFYSEQASDAESMVSLAENLDDDALRCDALITQADYFFNTEIIKAGDPAKRAIEIARNIGDKVRQAYSLYQFGYWAWHRDDWVNSRPALEDAYKLFSEAGLLSDAARCLHRLSLTLGSLGEQEAALETAGKAIALSREAGDSRQEATGLRRLAIAHNNNHQYDLALPYAEQALDLHRALGDRGQEVNGLNVLGILHAWLNDQAKSESYLQESLALAKFIGHGFGIRAAVTNMGIYLYLPRGEYEGWLGFLETLLHEALVDEDELRVAYFLYFKARVLHLFGQYSASSAILHSFLETSEDRLSEWELMGTYRLISRNHAELGNFEVAKKSFEKSIQHARDSGVELLELYSQQGLAVISMLEGDQDGMQTVLGQLMAGVEEYREKIDYQELCDWLEIIARLYLNLGEYEAAVEYSSEVIDLMEGIPSPEAPEVKLLTHARILYALGRDDEARIYLQKAYDRVMLVANNTQDQELRASWLENVRYNREIITEYNSRIL